MRKPWRISFGLAQSQSRSGDLSESIRCYPESVQPNRGNTTVLRLLLRQTGARGAHKQKISGKKGLFKSVWSPARKPGNTHCNIPVPGATDQMQISDQENKNKTQTGDTELSTWEGSLGEGVQEGRRWVVSPLQYPSPYSSKQKTQEFRGGVLLKLKHYHASVSCSMSPFTDTSNIHRNSSFWTTFRI